MKRRTVLAGGVALSAIHTIAYAQTRHEVDLALVLAVDASRSIDAHRWKLQLDGYSEAFRSQEVLSAVRGGSRQAIAVTMVQWSEYAQQNQSIDWQLIRDDETMQLFADRIAIVRRLYHSGTSISGALLASIGYLDACPFDATRLAIDISGDGSNNGGPDPSSVRGELRKRRITVNGLPIINNHPTSGDPHVIAHYEAQVKFGPGSFIEIAEDFEVFNAAIKKKLPREIRSS